MSQALILEAFKYTFIVSFVFGMVLGATSGIRQRMKRERQERQVNRPKFERTARRIQKDDES